MRTHYLASLLLLGLTSAQATSEFRLSSPDIQAGGSLSLTQVFKGFGCEGTNQSPALNWHNAPKGTQSFALTLYDPDAPTGSGWWHWVVYNLPADSRGLVAGAGAEDGRQLPPGTIQGRTDFGSPGFGGACPPVGDKPHRYVFRLHALKVPRLELPKDATAALIGYMIHQNSLAQTSFTAYYQR